MALLGDDIDDAKAQWSNKERVHGVTSLRTKKPDWVADAPEHIHSSSKQSQNNTM